MSHLKYSQEMENEQFGRNPHCVTKSWISSIDKFTYCREKHKLLKHTRFCNVVTDKNPLVVSDRFIVHQIVRMYLHEYILQMNHLSIYLHRYIVPTFKGQKCLKVMKRFNKRILGYFDCQEMKLDKSISDDEYYSNTNMWIS